MKVQKKKKSQKSEAIFNRIFLIASIAVAVLVFGRVAFNEYKNKADYSINFEAVDPTLLVKPHSPVRGPPLAKITMVEFLDPECGSCRYMHFMVRKLEEEFGSDLRVVIRYLPLHSNSRYAASALEEAREIGKHGEALDVLFDNQHIWGQQSMHSELIPELLEKIGLSKERTSKELVIAKHKWKVDLDEADAAKIGIQKAPTFFVNGRIMRPMSYESIRNAIVTILKNRESLK